ncbi:hypothetical protein MMC09_004829 [Bachmanniomyces sp. S44760]|nr:hypothetical protein [Bachmanniomyces sp. S44760]
MASLPFIAEPSLPTKSTNPESISSSTASTSDNDSEEVVSPNTLKSPGTFPSRPKLGSRKSSGTIIVPRDHPEVETKYEDYPPEDARAMSPRRNSEEMEKLSVEARAAVQGHAKSLQSGLAALAERIETVKSDHEKLEKQNVALQDYIGGLTRSMSNTNAVSSSKAKK